MKLDLTDRERDVLRRCLLAGDEKLRKQLASVEMQVDDFGRFEAHTNRAVVRELIRRVDGHGR